MIPVSTCPSTTVGTLRNTLHTLLQSSASSSRRGSKCRKLGKAVVKQSEAFKNLLQAAWSKDTVLLDVGMEARKVEIEQTQQMLQKYQKAHDEAITKMYKQLRNLLSGDLQSQWDNVFATRCTSMTRGLE
jgi:hypothetical protein